MRLLSSKRHMVFGEQRMANRLIFRNFCNGVAVATVAVLCSVVPAIAERSDAEKMAAKFAQPNAMSKSFSQSTGPELKNKRSESVVGLFMPIMRSHPEALEGRPTTVFKLAKRTDNSGFVVEVVQTGYLDDSVSGQRFVGFVSWADGMWNLDSLWRQQMCYRGPRAGQWKKGSCS